MNYKETLDRLYNMLPDFQRIGAGAYKPGLERALEFNRHLGNPDRDFLAVHVAGTNGKGSVSHMLASILADAGYRTGLYTSPHLIDFRERIKVDGEMIPQQYVVDFTERNSDKMNELRMSFFEATMGMAFKYFAESQVEVAVIETGLGGRLDSTNILLPAVSVITNIGMDHMAFLGDTPEQIAAEKAGIIKAGIPVVIGETDPRTAPVFKEKAEQSGSPIMFADKIYTCEDSRTGDDGRKYYSLQCPCKQSTMEAGTDLMGDYQCKNLITALATVDALNLYSHLSISHRSALEGCAKASTATGLHGRWQIASRDPLIVLDAGHNTHGLKQTMLQLSTQKFDKLYFVLGISADKEIGAMLSLLPHEAHYIFTRSSGERGMDPAKLATAAADAGLQGEVRPNVGEALERARELASPSDMIFVGGSCFIVGDALATI